ncbi:hypothetical protein BASA83_012307 [Batrachochytrium salamandrivorans]|nr:hypothetical protein BASA83_012307 [Batrachochytrium salamandrivorans]
MVGKTLLSALFRMAAQRLIPVCSLFSVPWESIWMASLAHPLMRNPLLATSLNSPLKSLSTETWPLEPEDGYLSYSVIFVLKEKNAKKINSHKWFFNAVCEVIFPEVTMLLDVGTKPSAVSFYHLYRAFERDPRIGGACRGSYLCFELVTKNMRPGFSSTLNLPLQRRMCPALFQSSSRSVGAGLTVPSLPRCTPFSNFSQIFQSPHSSIQKFYFFRSSSSTMPSIWPLAGPRLPTFILLFTFVQSLQHVNPSSLPLAPTLKSLIL